MQKELPIIIKTTLKFNGLTSKSKKNIYILKFCFFNVVFFTAEKNNIKTGFLLVFFLHFRNMTLTKSLQSTLFHNPWGVL